MFDSLPALAPPKPADLHLELDRYISGDVEYVTDPLDWWYKQRRTYPQLSHMALDYLTIPGEFYCGPPLFLWIDFITATSIDIEQLFSRGRLLLSHVCSRLSAQSTRALLCLGI